MNKGKLMRGWSRVYYEGGERRHLTGRGSLLRGRGVSAKENGGGVGGEKMIL